MEVGEEAGETAWMVPVTRLVYTQRVFIDFDQ